MKRVMTEMNMKDVTIVYGMTETSPGSFQTSTDDETILRVETVGKVHPHVACKIVGENGELLPINEVGELWTKGYNVMSNYWNNEKQTQESIINGWMQTGDLATFDNAGYCRIVGRKKDIIIRGGENVYPREIEDYLLTNPKIQQAEVIGVPDIKYGEQVCVWIKRKSGCEDLTEKDVQDFCTNKIAHYKIPHYILFKESFPLTVTGKVMKNVMRDETKIELKLTI